MIEVYRSFDWVLVIKDGKKVYADHSVDPIGLLSKLFPDAKIVDEWVKDEVAEAGEWDGETKPLPEQIDRAEE